NADKEPSFSVSIFDTFSFLNSIVSLGFLLLLLLFFFSFCCWTLLETALLFLSLKSLGVFKICGISDFLPLILAFKGSTGVALLVLDKFIKKIDLIDFPLPSLVVPFKLPAPLDLT